MKRYLPSLVSAIFIAAALPSAAQVMNYQGRLTDASGNPLADGLATIEFSLWDLPAGGTQIWGPFTMDGATGNGKGPKADLVNGRFNSVLGPNDSTGRALSGAFNNTTRFLQIKIGSNPAITPRQALLDAPTALMAQRIPNVWTTGTNLGIGKTTPTHPLHVVGEYYGKGDIRLHANEGDGSTGTAYLQARDDSALSSLGLMIRTKSGNLLTDAMYINPAGKIGIGTTGPLPDARFTIQQIGYGLRHTDGTRSLATYLDPSGAWVGTVSNDSLQFYTNNSQPVVIIETSGQFVAKYGANITGDSIVKGSSSYPLTVMGSDGLPLVRISAASDPFDQFRVWGHARKNDGDTGWWSFSDARLKDRVKPYGDGLDKILKLQPVRYHYKENASLGLKSKDEHIGFIAQEVQKVIPEAVIADGDGYLNLSVDPIHWTVVNAIKDLHALFTKEKGAAAAQINALTAENTALRDTVKAQEARLAKLEKAVTALAAGRSPEPKAARTASR